MRHLFPAGCIIQPFLAVPLALFIKVLLGKMHRHQFRGQHSSEGMQESKDTYP